MNEITLLEDFDYAITSVRDTDWHWVDEGEDIQVGVIYGDVECAVTECAEKWQASHDMLTEQNKMLQDALQMVVDMIPMNQNAHGGGYNLILSNDDCRIIKETLNICDLINEESKTC
jgi:hypothetical protein